MRAASACGLLLGLAYGAPTPTVAAASSSAALRLLSSSDSSAAELHGRRLQGGARPCAAGYSLNPAAAWACDAANGTASLDAQICIPNVCTCAFGAGVVSGTTNPALGLCEEDGAADCSACHTGYDLDAPAGAGAQACIVGGCNTVADLDATTSCIDTLHWPYDAAASCTGLAAFEPAAAAIRVIQRYSDGAKATQARLDSASATGSFACAPGYHLNPNVQFVCGALGGVATLNAQACLPNVCTCPAGNATVAVGLDWGEAFLCEEHGAVDCSSCWDLRAPQANSGGCSGSQQLGATYNGWGQPCNSNSRYVITAPAGPGAQACIQDGCHTVADLDDSPSCGLAECNQTKYTSSYCASLGLFYDNSNPDHTTNVDIECCVGSWTGCGGNCRRYYQHCTGLAAFEPAAATATQRYNKEPLYTPATQALLNGASATGSFACATGYKLNPDVQFVCGLNRGLSQHYQQSEYPNFTPSTWPTRLNAQVCLRGEDVCTCAFGTATVGSACEVNGTNDCASCDAGFHLSATAGTGAQACMPDPLPNFLCSTVANLDAATSCGGTNCTNVDAFELTAAANGYLSGHTVLNLTGTACRTGRCGRNFYCEAAPGKWGATGVCTSCGPGDGCGCTDILAFNFDAAAIHDDSSCSYAPAATAYMYDERNATADFETVSGCYAIGPPGVRPLVKNCAISGNLPYHFGGKRYSLNDCSFAQEDSACYEVIDNWNQGSMDVEHTFGPWQQLEISGPAVVGGATFDGAVVGLNPVPVGLPWPSPITQPWGTWGAIENGAAIQMAPFATNVAPVNCQTCQTCQLTIFDSTFTKMYAGSIHPFSGADSAPELSSQTGFGGAVFQFGSVFSSTGTPTCGGKEQTMTVLRSTFDSNSAFSSGGAIYQGAGGSMNVSLSNFISNTAMYGNGGAIYTGGTLIVWRSTFTSNEASRGGAIYVAKNGVLAILLCLFAFNTGASGGAVGTAIGSSVTISLSGFASNSATDGSGAHLYLDGPESFAIRDVPFTPFVPGSSSVSASGLGSCEIHPCPLGHGCSYTNYSLACAPCASGTVGVDGIRCSLCQPGEEPNANQTQCKPCSGATISQFGVECVQCDDVVDQEKTSCSECQAGKETNGDRTACVNCVGATFSTSGTCRTCDQPNVVDAAHITCTKCSPGEEPNTNWTQCLACLGNTFSQFGNDCTACAPGLASNSNHTACDDLNECITKNGGCDPISTCQGQNGGVCSDPSKTTATTCNALNATWMPDCSKGCTNLEGSYRCGVCPNGFIKSDIFDNVTSRLMGSLCVSPPPPPAGSSETNVLPSATMQITASAAALQQGSKAQLQLVAALQADLAASLGVDPSEITISNINAAGSRRRVLQSGGTAVEFEFVIDSPDASAQDLLATLKQQLQNSSSPLMTGSVSELGYSIPAAQADALSFTFTCPPGTIQGAGTTCQLCPQMPKAQYTDDSETCKQCPVNQQVNAKGTGCSCADGHYDASLGPLICYAVGESWAAADFGAAVAGQTECSNCPALCMPCGELASCVSCTGGIATLNAGAATSEDSKSAAIGLAPTNGIVGPLAMFVCPSNGCLAQNAAGNNGSWLSPCEKGYVGALCSACDTDANFVKDGATCDACADSASPEYFAWLVAIVVVATVIFCAANKLNSEKAQDVMVSEPEPPPEQEPEDATSTAANKTKAAKALATSNTASAVAGAVAASVADKLKSGGNGSGDVASIVALSMVQVKILIGVFQISSELPTVLQIDYPESFNQLLTAVGVLMVDIFEVFKLDCVSPLSLHTRFVCVMLMPPVCIGLVQLLRVFANCRISNGSTYAEGADQTSEPSVVQRKAANRSKADYRSAFVVVLLYPLLCRTCFRMYACKELSETEGWHPDDFTIACNDSVHYFFLLLATIGVIVYPIGIPAGFMFILHRDKRKTDAGGTPSASLEFLRVDYKPDCYYYECVTLAEKLLITGLLSFVEQGSIFQTFCGSCIAFYFFGHALYTWPFVHAMDNVLKIVAEAQLFLTLLISIVLRTELRNDLLTSDDYGSILVAAFLAVPSVELFFACKQLARWMMPGTSPTRDSVPKAPGNEAADAAVDEEP